jgi:hypothetical protein
MQPTASTLGWQAPMAQAAAGVPYRQRICKVLQDVVSVFDDHRHYEAAENLERDHWPSHQVKALQKQS